MPTPNALADPANPLKPAVPSLSLSIGGITLVSITNVAPNAPTKTASLTITTTTDNPTGYNTTLSTNHSTNTCLLRSSDSDCSIATVPKINPVTGTVTSPSTLNANEWGATLTTDFTTTNPDITDTTDQGKNNIWFQIPNQTSPVVINSTTAPTAATGNSQDLTLGTKVDYSLPADSYSNTIVITATANSYSTTPTITNITPNTGEPTSNEQITITGTNLEYASQVFIDLDKDGIQDSGEECTSANIDSNTQITCDTPTATAGTYDVVVKTWGGETKPATNPAANTVTTTDDYTYQYPIPNITSTSNSISIAYGTTSGTATANTNMNADCRWSLTNQTYASMTNNFTTGQNTTTHSTIVTGLTAGLNTIYISCANPSDASRFSANNTTTVTISAIPTMQAFTTADCNTMPIGGTTTLLDTRNNKTYKIIKLEMGVTNRCWMQENLTIAGITITSTDSNVTSDFIIPAVTTTAPSDSYTVTNPAYHSSYSSYGYLYNWATTIAYSNAHYGGSDSQALTSGTAQYSICPKGWRLPVGGAHTSGSTTGTNEFSLVDVNSFGGTGANRTGDTTILAEWRNASSGFGAVYAGDFGGGSFGHQGSYARFWSSSVSSSINAHALTMNATGYVYPQGNSSKYVGFSVRCIFGN